MEIVANFLIGIVALVHVGILCVEMFLWRMPAVHTRLGFNQEQADAAAPIVANAGLFNGFLAAGLVWGLLATEASFPIKAFFLSCIVVAGIFGAATLKPTTLVLQSLPAAVALALAWVSRTGA